MKKISAVLTTAALACANAAMIPMGPLNAGSGNTVGEGKVRTALIYESVTKDEAYDGTQEIPNTKNRKSTKKVTKLKVKYGIRDDLELKIAIPYLEKTSKSNTDQYKNSGIGDILLKANYQILNERKGDLFFWSASLGLKLDNGQTDKMFDTSKGVKIVPTIQLGTGSKDLYLESGVTKMFERSRFDGYFTYIRTGKGDNQYQYGDTKKLEAGYAYAVTKPFGIQAVLSYVDKGRNKENGQKLGYTGGKQLSITPAFTYKINKKYDISVGYVKVLKVDMNYDSAKKVGELVADDAFVVKFGMNF